MKDLNRELAKQVILLNQAVIMTIMDQPGDYSKEIEKIEKSTDRLRKKFNFKTRD